MPSSYRAVIGALTFTTAICCSPDPSAVDASTLQRSDAARPQTDDRSVAARRGAVLRAEANRVSGRGECGPDRSVDVEPSGCEYARLFHALALFQVGGRDSAARGNADLAAAVPLLQGDLRGANAISPTGKLRRTKITFHFQRALLVHRLIRSFGQNGVIARGVLNADNERRLRQVAGQWASTHCRVADADPSRTWRIYLSENHHAQLVASCWAVADLARDGRDGLRYADGSDAVQQYARWTRYVRAWLTERRRYGLMEFFSPTYTAYTLEPAYAYAQFAQDAALRAAASGFLDGWWADWAQQQIDGVFGGSMTRVYPQAVAEGSPMQGTAWTYFGFGTQPNPNPANAAALTSNYRPPATVVAAAFGARAATPRCIREAAPGRVVGVRQGDWTTIEPSVPSALRTTCSGQGYVMGGAGDPPQGKTASLAGRRQNDAAVIAFAGGPDNRIAIVGNPVGGKSSYDALIAVQNDSAMLVKSPGRGVTVGANGLRVWFGPHLNRSDRGGWVFVEGSARAAIRPTTGGYRWEGNWLVPDDPTAGIVAQVATLKAGSAASFQRAVLASRVSDNGAAATFAHAGSAPPLRIDLTRTLARRKIAADR